MSDPTTVGRTRRAAGRVLLATVTALAAAGCGDSDEGTDTAKPSASHASHSPSPTTSSPSPAVTAADGSNPAACTDGNCEIAVTEPVTIRIKLPDGPAKLSLTKVGKNAVDYKVTSGNSKTSGGASGDGSGCVAVFRSGGSSSSCGMGGPPPDKVDGAVVLQVVAGADGTAILRLISG
ncbi:hypothetical protein B7755_020640 [Streptomyces sp. NBS 14/10]|uniref:hypothetical protein n=1 Tax=Streptomyces sp. NBS 14/10 TaxID=1945643 RepID=UPI000B7E436D|nr:hypothetical protein [Streptomyces sp. NBS 14/10]KAK1180344.1 hypothetical protein B7755_020640 [Streptomyces sp. NBS 14/10]